MTKKKKTPTEQIEEDYLPHLEVAYAKFPRGRLHNISQVRKPHEVYLNFQEMKDLLEKYGKSAFTQIHTHATRGEISDEGAAFPSGTDIKEFLDRDYYKTMVIAARDAKNGKVLGYTILKKKKTTIHPSLEGTNPAYLSYSNILSYLRKLEEKIRRKRKRKGIVGKLFGLKETEFQNSSERIKLVRELLLSEVCEKYGLVYKHVKVKDSEHYSSLEAKVAVFLFSSVAGIALSISSLKATGNAISNLTGTNQGLFGLLLFVIGLFGLMFNK